jgi:hypothetical protein
MPAPCYGPIAGPRKGVTTVIRANSIWWERDQIAATATPQGPLSTQPVWKRSLCTRMKNIWKVIGRLTNHDCEISSTSDQILRAGGVWVGFHTGWTLSGSSI